MTCVSENHARRVETGLLVKGSFKDPVLPKALTEAWEINSREGVIDTELNLMGEKPKFGNHGNRRKADKVACETMDVTKATVGEINDHFGWEQKERKKKSQLHYKGSITGIRGLESP